VASVAAVNRLRAALLALGALPGGLSADVQTGTATTAGSSPVVEAGRAAAQRESELQPGPADSWPLAGRDAAATYYSPLTQINARNVRKLGFAWEFKTGGFRSLQATPLVVNGILYASGNWGVVYALDAASGHLLWQFDPYADGRAIRRAEVDVPNRGVALWRNSVFVVSFDCRAYALDARTGALLWSVETAEDPRYTCTGAPLVADQVLVVGNGGSDRTRGGLRGYVTGYELASGAPLWRAYLVPKPGDPNPSPELERAESSWDPTRDPSFGGGGNPWNGMTYDPDLRQLYVGTGNAAPYVSAREIGGQPMDRLYTASIVALDPVTGRMHWHYQATPGDIWDFDAAAPVVLADLSIAGRMRKTLLQANKNGYFYVLDRTTGLPISAQAFAFMSWSTGLDRDFRPIVSPQAGDAFRPRVNYPGTIGAHTWAPMSYSPRTGLVYLPALDTPSDDRAPETRGAQLPGSARRVLRGSLKAWNPVQQRLVWERRTSERDLVLQGGALATAGDVVFAGREDGQFVAYAANTGATLLSMSTGAATVAAPMTYAVDGTQYLAVMQGQGGVYTFALESANQKQYLTEGRILALKIGGSAVPRPVPPPPPVVGPPPAATGTPADIATGRALFNTWCVKCHALSRGGGVASRLLFTSNLRGREVFRAIVLQGALVPRGMARFNDVLTPADADALYAFLVDTARAAYGSSHATTTPQDNSSTAVSK
jgi:quinohemoprotein ethanol dehydrogenase